MVGNFPGGNQPGWDLPEGIFWGGKLPVTECLHIRQSTDTDAEQKHTHTLTTWTQLSTLFLSLYNSIFLITEIKITFTWSHLRYVNVIMQVMSSNKYFLSRKPIQKRIFAGKSWNCLKLILHTETFFWNLTNPNQILIVITFSDRFSTNQNSDWC